MNCRRPLFFITLSYATGIAGSYIFPFRIAPVTAVCCVLLVLCLTAVSILMSNRHNGNLRSSSAPNPHPDASSYGNLRSSSAPNPHPDASSLRGVAPRNNPSIAKHRLLISFCLLFVLFGAFRSASEFSYVDPLADWATLPYNNLPPEFQPKRTDPIAEQNGRILSLQKEGEGYCDFVVYADQRNVLLRVKGENFNPSTWIGRKLSFTGTVEIPSGRRNPGSFDYALYLRTKGIHVIVNTNVKDIRICPEASDRAGVWISNTMDIKYRFLHRVKGEMPSEVYSVFSGMLFGEKTDLSEDTYDLFRMSGIAHLLCVSGLHVAILYAALQRVLGGRRTMFTGITALIFLFGYAFFSEFSPSVCRASLMIALHILSRIILSRYDLTTGIAAAALLLLLYRPAILFSTGFQLSFLCVLILAFTMPFFNRYTGYRNRLTGAAISKKELRLTQRTIGERCMEFAGKQVLPLFILQAAMAPMTAYTFCYVPLAGILLNIPFVAMASIILPIGLFMFVLSAASALLPEFLLPLSAFAFRLGAQAETILIDFMLTTTKRLCASSIVGIQVISPRVQVVFLFYCALFLFTSEGFRIVRRRGIRWVLPVCTILCLVIALGSFTSPVCQRNMDALTFIDVGQGDCLHIRTPDNRNFLVDGGGSTRFDVGKKTLLPYLLKNGVDHLDGVFVSHLHTDHFEGLRELSQHMDIGKVYLYEANRVRTEEVCSGSAIRPENLVFLAKGDRVQLDREVSVSILYPPRADDAAYLKMTQEAEDENRTSLLMLVDYEGITTLMTGDMGEDGEKAVLAAGKDALRADILKVGHHGSKTSSSELLLDAVNPDFSIIQCGRNTFGHPTREVIEKLHARDIIVLRNDLYGAVRFKIDEGKIIGISETTGRFPADRTGFT